MSGSGPARAAELGLPTPRPASGTPVGGSAPVGSSTPATPARRASLEVPTEAHAAVLGPEDTGAGLGTGEILALLRSADGAPGAADAPIAGGTERPAAFPGPETSPGDDSPTSPGVAITHTHAVWFWMWGPLLAAVLVVSFLAGMASAPVALPSATAVRPASLLDLQGRLLTAVDPPAGGDQVPADQLPDLLLRSIVAVQDPGYFSRSGLSAGDLVKAGAADLVRVRRHGTSIEERYAHQVRVAGDSELPSLRESTVAARLAQKLSRRALLTRYVNGMYFGNGVYGVSGAARFYFGESVTTLDAAQIAMLAGFADDPSRQNPVVAPALAITGQQRAVRAMQTAGLLTPQQAAATLREPIDARAHRQLERPSPAPDFTALVESSLLSRFGDDLVYGSDLQVTTPLDLDLQSVLSDTVRRMVPTNVPAVLALATDPRTGDIRAMVNRSASSSASGPEGAGDVLFTRRPLGTLATTLPVPVGSGRTASLGEVASTVGAVATDGVRRDLRALTSVRRPAQLGEPAQTLDQADPLPVGQPIMAPDRAHVATAQLRGAARLRGTPSAALPFQLTAVSGVDGPADSATSSRWYVGCVPELCITVWTGDAAAVPADAPPVTGELAGSIVATTLQEYSGIAAGRITLPPLPQVRDTQRRNAPTGGAGSVPTPRPSVPAGPAPAPTVSLHPSAAPAPTTKPSAAGSAPAIPSPSASVGGGTTGSASGSGEGAPVAVGTPGSGTDPTAGT